MLRLLLLMPLLLTACGRGRNSPKCPIKIGIINSATGNQAVVGLESVRGYEMAVEELNAAGGILGCQVELIIEDDGSSSEQARLNVKELVEKHQVLVIIGAASSGITMAAAGVANVYEVPFIVPIASSDLVTQLGYTWVFRINAPSSAYANTALDFAREHLGTEATLAIIYEASFYGESAAVAAAVRAAEHHIEIVFYESYEPGMNDYAMMLTRVKEINPDIIYFASRINEAKLLMQQCESLNINPKLYLGNAGGFIQKEFLEIGRNAEYVIATTQWAPDVTWPGASEFATEFIARYETEPIRSAQTYTALLVAKDAIERAAQQEEVDWNEIDEARLAIREALRNTNLQETIFGPISFDRAGQNNHPVILIQVIDGNFITIHPEQYKARAPIVPVPTWRER